MKRLQVLKNGVWEFVFAYSGNVKGEILTVKDKTRALSAKKDLDYFQTHFANHQFRGR